ncbi:MAG: Uncharacterised protein [Methanobacteriota archaeon]|nr:MAG: Uncharacterised protein [Euryarchaeota archaeon]
MSWRCEITGMSREDCNNWPDLHSKITGELVIKEPSEKIIQSFDKPLNNIVLNNSSNKNNSKRRSGLFRHLEKSIASKFKDSTMVPFGSSETGLSLKKGDLDLCLIVPNGKEKQIVKRISAMMERQGMENVKALTRAKVPIVKFSDPRSGIDVDISVNNTLALHNTKLLSAYSKLDKRVKELVICIKYWALHRNLSDSHSGTFSSYTWSILAIQHLQIEGVIPNLQVSEERTIETIEGQEYDITINEELTSDDSNKSTLSQLLYRFFKRYANWNWDDDIVSIRNGAPLTRDSKGWNNETPSAFDIINSESKKPPYMGLHHLPVEDPLAIEHDLCRVVRAEGELRIKDELIRTVRLFGEGSTWKEICSTIDEGRLSNLEPDDLFHDLRTLPDHSVRQMRENLSAEIAAVETRINALDDEKNNSMKMANAMRGVVKETSGIKKEHKSIITGLGARSKEIDLIKTKRDTISKNIILPKHMIEEELIRVYNRLTEEVDIHSVPSLYKEMRQFSWFLELQAMHAKAIEATQLHENYVSLVKTQKSEIKKLKIFADKHDEATEKILSEEPLLKDVKISSGQVLSYNRRVKSLQKAIRQRQNELHKMRRESGRLDAWLRKKQNGNSNKRYNNSKRGKQKDRKRSDSNAPLTIGDISQLLSSSNNVSSESKKVRKTKSKKAGMKKLGNLGAQRGKRSQFKPKDRH